ncbi:hypothetical protein MPSEU_000335300 [Mayamaea pseudoterrestris]|nr:hypothetical protein MPSEU_000335300 [Mayamaea pseudoterrestris]
MASKPIQFRMNRFALLQARPLLVVTLAIAVILLVCNRFMASSSSPSQAHALESQTTSKHVQHRILCYGDSLTAGTTNSYTLYPYAPFLERALKAAGRENVQVRHVGLPGWTAQQMVATASEKQGIESQILRVKDPSLSLVVILAGTNDLGHGFGEDEIAKNVLQLHKIARRNQVPATLAIAIPPSGYTSQNEAARLVVQGVNEALQEYSAREPNMSFTPFPFEFERGGENWSPDTLHLSPTGYEKLGQSLASVVGKILDQLEE